MVNGAARTLTGNQALGARELASWAKVSTPQTTFLRNKSYFFLIFFIIIMLKYIKNLISFSYSSYETVKLQLNVSTKYKSNDRTNHIQISSIDNILLKAALPSHFDSNTEYCTTGVWETRCSHHILSWGLSSHISPFYRARVPHSHASFTWSELHYSFSLSP